MPSFNTYTHKLCNVNIPGGHYLNKISLHYLFILQICAIRIFKLPQLLPLLLSHGEGECNPEPHPLSLSIQGPYLFAYQQEWGWRYGHNFINYLWPFKQHEKNAHIKTKQKTTNIRYANRKFKIKYLFSWIIHTASLAMVRSFADWTQCLLWLNRGELRY